MLAAGMSCEGGSKKIKKEEKKRAHAETCCRLQSKVFPPKASFGRGQNMVQENHMGWEMEGEEEDGRGGTPEKKKLRTRSAQIAPRKKFTILSKCSPARALSRAAEDDMTGYLTTLKSRKGRTQFLPLKFAVR